MRRTSAPLRTCLSIVAVAVLAAVSASSASGATSEVQLTYRADGTASWSYQEPVTSLHDLQLAVENQSDAEVDFALVPRSYKPGDVPCDPERAAAAAQVPGFGTTTFLLRLEPGLYAACFAGELASTLSVTGPVAADQATGGHDALHGTTGPDRLNGGAGHDLIRAGHGPDVVDGGAGDDHLHGGRGDDTLRGGPGDDTLHGGVGADSLSGGAGDDTVLAADGEPDTIACGTGADTVAADPSDRTTSCETVTSGSGDALYLVNFVNQGGDPRFRPSVLIAEAYTQCMVDTDSPGPGVSWSLAYGATISHGVEPPSGCLPGGVISWTLSGTGGTPFGTITVGPPSYGAFCNAPSGGTPSPPPCRVDWVSRAGGYGLDVKLS